LETKSISIRCYDGKKRTPKGVSSAATCHKKLIQGEIWKHKLELVVFSASKPVNPPNFGLKTNYLGELNDDISLALVCTAADIFVAP
jgi:hypothetical protein